MASEKITAMPDLAGGQVPTDLVTAVDLSAPPASQNVKSTLNDLFATITKNITDRAVRFQAPGTAPTVSAATQGSIYHNGTTFLASSNGGAYEQVYTLAAQTAALVFAGPTTGGPSIPTFRALALTDLPTQTGTGNIVLATNPVMTNPTIDIGITGVSSGRILGFQPVTSGVNYVDVYNAISSAGPTLQAAGTATNIALNLHAKGTGIVACVGNALRITGSTAGSNGIVQARGGTSSGGVIQLYELTTNGTNWVGFRSPDLLAANLEFQLPSADGTAGQAVTTDGAGGLGFSSFVNLANPVTFKNLLINGDMIVDQRNSGGSVTINSATNKYTVDRWLAVGQATDGVFTVQQSTTAPTGFQNSIIATVTTADTSISSTQFYGIAQYIEGLNSARLLWGTANAKTVTLSFWVRCSATGTFGGAIRNGATNRAYPFEYTISAANTFEYKTITIPGDTSGTWATDNTSGPQVWFSLGAGSSRAGTAGAWNGNNNISATGATNLIGTLNATFYVSGVQLEENSTATPFEYLPIDVQLGRCLRYLYRVSGTSWRLFGVLNPGASYQIVYMPVATRAPVSLEFNLSELRVQDMGNSTISVPSLLTIPLSTPLLNLLYFQVPAVSGNGLVSFAYGTASSFINLSAEL